MFHNKVKNYIYADTLDRYEDFRLIEYTQRDAEFTGVEGELRHQFTPVFSAAVFGDYVRGKLTGGDGNLPRIPAARAGLRGNVKWQQWSGGVEYARVFSQKDIAAYEKMCIRDRYQVMKVGRVPLIPYRRPGDPVAAAQVAALAAQVRGALFERLGPVAVSYTHLDVYKRQAPCRRPARWWWPAPP